MPADVQIRFKADSNAAKREINQLQQEVKELQQGLGQTARSADSASDQVQEMGQQSGRAAREVDKLGREIFETREEAQRLGGVYRDLNGRLRESNGRFVATGRGLGRLTEGLGGASGGANVLTRNLGGLSTVVGGIGIAVAAHEVFQLGSNSVRAAVQVESATNSLTALHGSATVANATIERLRELAQSPGISFPQAVNAAVRLKTVNIEGELAFDTIAELGNSLALVGSTDLSGILLGLTQIVSAGKVTTEEIRQITERSGIAAQAIQNAFGSLIGDDIQQQLEARGQDVRDFVQILVDELAGGARASADSTANAFSNLGNASFELQAAIGERLNPIVKAATLGLTGFFESITEGIRGTRDFTEVLAELNAELSRASGTIQLREAIDAGAEALEAFIRQSEDAIRNNSAFFGAREDAILTAQINQAREALQGYVGVQEQNIETEAELRSELARQETELRRIQGAQTDRNNLIAEQGASARQASRIYLEERRKEEEEVNASIDELETKLAAYDAVGMAAEEATTTATEGTQEATEATTEAIAEVQRLTDIYAGLTQNVREYAEFLELIDLTGASDFFTLVRGEIEAYDASLQMAIPSVVNLTTAENALTAAIEANLRVLDDFAGDAQQLIDTYESLSDGLTSFAADQAIANAEIRLVNPAVSEAVTSMRSYVDVMGDVQTEFQSVETISDMVTASVREQASAFDELRGSVESVADAVPSDIFDRFDTRTPGTASGISQDNADVFENFQVGLQSIGFEFLREGAFQQNAEDIDTVGESVTAFGDILARVASGDLTALGDAVGRTFGIIEAQNEAFEQRRRQRRIDAIEERTTRAFRFGNLEAVGRIGGVDDIYSVDALGGFRQAVASGDSQGIGLNIAGASDALNIDERIETSLLNLVANLDRAITGADIDAIYQPFLTSFETAMERAGTNFESAIDTDAPTQLVTDSFNTYLSSINTYFDLQIRNVRDQERATGVFLTETIRAIETARAGTLNAARLLDTTPNLTGRGFRSQQRIRGAQSLAESSGTDRQATEDVARLQYGDVAYNAEVAAATAEQETPETVAEDALASVIEAINEDIGLINASILSLETQIDQASSPEEIAALLEQLPEQIREKYRLLRESLQERLDAGDITEDVFNASLSELASSESAELESQSDAVLANTLRAINEDVQLIDASIQSIQTQIDQISEPEAIAELLGQIPALITEKYRGLRESLDAKYAAGEISTDVYNASLTQINSSESAEVEQQSDAVLANALQINSEAVESISVGIRDLENRIAQSNDPAEIQTLLIQIAEQIPEIYRLRREALQSQYDAGEITKTALENGIAQLNIKESATLEQNSDNQLANALTINQQAINIISSNISALESRIAQSNDPQEIATLLIQITEQIPEIYRLRRETLQKQFDAGEITKAALETGLATLNIEESAALEQNSDDQLANLISDTNADIQIVSNEINRLTYEIRNSTDAAAIPTLLTDLQAAISEKYRLRREILQQQLDAEEITVKQYEGQLGAINLQETQELGNAETLASSEISSLQPDTALADALRINQENVDTLNTGISALENAISQSSDPAEIAQLLTQIGQQIPEIYRLRREALQAQFDAGEITKAALENGLANLNIEESAAQERNSDDKLANALLINQQSQNTINTQISALENAIDQSNDPTEIAELLVQIAQQIPEIYQLRRTALLDQYASGEITKSALETGLASINIEESAALEQNSDQQLANALSQHNTDIQLVSNTIESLSDQIRNSDDPAEIQSLVVDLRQAIQERYRLQREVLQKQLDAEEITIDQYNAELGSINRAESTALVGADRLAADEVSDLRSSANNLIENAIQRGERRLGQATSEQDFETIRAELLRLTNQYYDNEELRIAGLVGSETELQNLREDNAFAREEALERIATLDNEFTQDRIRREQEVADAAIQAAERAARAQAEQLRDQQQRRFALEDIGIGSQRGIEDLIRGSDYVDTLSDLINRQLGGFGLDQREQLVQDLSGRFGVETGFADSSIRVGGQAFAPGEDLQVQSAEEIRRQLTPIFSSLADNIPIEEFNNLILGIQSEQRDAIRGIEDENRENQRDTIFESMNAEILNNAWKSDIALIASNTALDPTDTPDTEIPISEQPNPVAIDPDSLTVDVPTPVVVTSENMESITPRDGKPIPVRIENGEVSIKGGVDINNAVEVTSTQLSNVIRALAQGDQPLNLIVQWGSGETTQVAGEIQQGIADGSILPFASGGGG